MESGPPVKKLRCGLKGYKSYIELGLPPPKSTLYDRDRKRKNLEDIAENKAEEQSKDVSREQLLFEGSKITLKESIVSILNLTQRHPAVNKETLCDVIATVKAHLPKHVNVPHLESMFKFCKIKQQCIQSSGNLLKSTHHVCPECFHLFIEDELTCPTNGCKGVRYKNGDEPQSAFVELDLEKQIREFFSDATFLTDLSYRFTLPRDDYIRDIYNGELYKESHTFVKEPYNLTLLWHTDGVQVYNSNTNQLWPITAVINELPPWKRFSKQRFLLLGLYYGRHKPDMNSFLAPFILTLNRLYLEGLPITLPDGSSARCRVKTLVATMDLPAVAAVRNIHQWNGDYGCGMCEIEGEVVVSGRGTARSYSKPIVPAKIRTQDTIMSQAVEAIASGGTKVVYGVKGLSVAVLLKDVDLAKCFVVDFMHGGCLGYMKRMIHCWIDDSGQPYCIKKHISEIDNRLACISPPTAMRRYPLKFSELPLTKASQYRDFILFYGLHVLQGILPHKYHVHFGLLVRAVYILCQNRISQPELKMAAKLLDTFYGMMDKYYGKTNCTLNVHNLGTHMVQCVKLVGPLFTHTAFFFESVCGDLASMVTGPRNPVKQITDGVCRMQEFRTAVSIQNDFSEEVKMILRKDRRKLHPLGHNFVHTKTKQVVTLTEQETHAVNNLDEGVLKNTTSVASVSRVERYKVVFEAHTTKQKRHQDSFISYMYDGTVHFGVLRRFITVKQTNIALINPFAEDSLSYPYPITPQKYFDMFHTSREELTRHMSSVKFQESILHAVELKNIKRKLVYMPTSTSTGMVVELPSSFEHN